MVIYICRELTLIEIGFTPGILLASFLEDIVLAIPSSFGANLNNNYLLFIIIIYYLFISNGFFLIHETKFVGRDHF